MALFAQSPNGMLTAAAGWQMGVGRNPVPASSPIAVGDNVEN
jgi:hypothetical protein